ncbi:MAG: hypothetical protein PHP54_05380 [Clostridia bacterium]|nr:hypothetical protein [Clostridia bacterium]
MYKSELTMREKKGISLITLVITIIVVIVLAAAVLLILNNNNPIFNSKEARYSSDRTTVQYSVITTLQKIMLDTKGNVTATPGEITDNKFTYTLENGTTGEVVFDTKANEANKYYAGTKLPNYGKWLIDSKGNIALEVDGKIYGSDIYFGTNGNTTANVASVNKPVLNGMSPVKYIKNGDTYTEVTENILEIDPEWYAYIAGDNVTDTRTSMWANAQSDDGSYWVWIPRYAYRITEKPTTTENLSGKIEVVFLEGTSNNYYENGVKKQAKKATDTTIIKGRDYIVHPGFTFGTEELTGIWVAKFEASHDDAAKVVDETLPSEGTSTKVKIQPNVTSWRNINVANIFDRCYEMRNNESYGWTTTPDTHMMKNVEWGAVAYLTHSQYGRNRNEITMNNNSNFIVGMACDTLSGNGTPAITNNYTTAKGQLASTTGNTSGIYDMSGGSWEYVAGNLNGYIVSAGSATEFNRIYNDVTLRNKYFDIYAVGTTVSDRQSNYEANIDRKGDAIAETSINETITSSWFSDYSYYIYSTYPFFLRGGGCFYTSRTGVFCFGYYGGNNYSQYSFRPVIAAKLVL